jgi:hypothetical protein
MRCSDEAVMSKWGHPYGLRSRAMTSLYLLLIVFLAICSNSCLCVKTSDQYLYYGVEGHKVQEYIAKPGELQPDFLFSTEYPNARVVEFYAQ